MAEAGFRGKSMKQVAADILDGYISVNPLLLKKFDKDMLKELHEHIFKAMTIARNLPAAFNDIVAIRDKNQKLQRLHNALIIIKHNARERRIPL